MVCLRLGKILRKIHSRMAFVSVLADEIEYSPSPVVVKDMSAETGDGSGRSGPAGC